MKSRRDEVLAAIRQALAEGAALGDVVPFPSIIARLPDMSIKAWRGALLVLHDAWVIDLLVAQSPVQLRQQWGEAVVALLGWPPEKGGGIYFYARIRE